MPYGENASFVLKNHLCSKSFIRQTEVIVMMIKEGLQNCKFHDPWVGVLVLGLGHLSHRVKTQYSFSSTLGHKYQFIIKMTKEGSTKIVNLRRVNVLYNFDDAFIYST